MKYERKLSDLKNVKKNGYKVFSCFSCGGGSSMGYKNAGYTVIGTCEIDPQMNDVYIKNHGKGYNFLMGVQDFKNIPNEELPNDLFDIDVLDGSPPCSTFSTSGLRERARGKEKKFREGQAKQVLSDLFFDYLDVVEKLKPKIVIAENVSGMLKGNAKGYLKMIFHRFDELGYNVQLFCLNGATMGLPQTRERIFFCAHRKEFKLPKLKLQFNEKPIPFKDVKDTSGKVDKKLAQYARIRIPYARYGDESLRQADERYRNKSSFFNTKRIYDEKVCNTITANEQNLVRGLNRYLNVIELQRIGSWPLDYNFNGVKPAYLIGMSVPPLMMYRVSKAVQEQRLDLIYKQKSDEK